MDRSKRSLKSRWRIPVSIEMSMGVHYNTFNVISHHVILSNSAPKMNLYSLFPKLQGLEMISDESRRNHSSKSMSVIRFLSMSKGFDFCNKAENQISSLIQQIALNLCTLCRVPFVLPCSISMSISHACFFLDAKTNRY